MKRWLYMYVTQDKYELPIYVADTSEELARLCGYSKSVIEHTVRSNTKKKRKFILVKINDDED